MRPFDRVPLPDRYLGSGDVEATDRGGVDTHRGSHGNPPGSSASSVSLSLVEIAVNGALLCTIEVEGNSGTGLCHPTWTFLLLL